MKKLFLFSFLASCVYAQEPFVIRDPTVFTNQCTPNELPTETTETDKYVIDIKPDLFPSDFSPSELMIQSDTKFDFDVRDNMISIHLFETRCHRPVKLQIYPWGVFKVSEEKHMYPVFIFRKCRNCYSEKNRHNKKYLIAKHGETRRNCGGRKCTCDDGLLTCEDTCHKRREYGALRTDSKGYDEKQLVIDAFWWVNENCQNGACGEFDNGDPWTFHQVMQHHLTYSGHAHGSSKFLPWHRMYLWDLESKMMKFHACVTLPYWDWSVDAGNEANARVFDVTYFGLPDGTNMGQFDSWDIPASFGTFARGGATHLNFGDEIAINNLLSLNDYSSFRVALEGSLHGIPHVYIGGQMGSFRSPADPLFWLHHCMIDKIWYDWQYDNNAVHFYDGSVQTQVSPQWNQVVEDVLDSKQSIKVCYENPRNYWLDLLKKIKIEHVPLISRVVPSFMKVSQNTCDACVLKLPEELAKFFRHNGLQKVDYIWCHLYNGSKYKRKGMFMDDFVVKQYVKKNTVKSEEWFKFPPTPSPTRSPTPFRCSMYNRKRLKCIRSKQCTYKNRRCLNT